MKQSYYIYNDGTIKRKDNTLQFLPDIGEKRDLPIERISDIYIMSETTFNTAFINFVANQGINLHFFNYYSFYTGSFYPKESLLSGNLLIKQALHYDDNIKRMTIAKQIVNAAAYGIYRNLRYYNERGKDLSESMQAINALRKNIDRTNNIKELMGYEGNIRKIYYQTWSTIINQPIDFEKRVKNPPDNLINTLISFVNMLIYTKVLGELYHTQLNPTISYLHEPGVRRFSLSLDLAEIFKPLIGDRLIFSLLNKNQITSKSFTKNLNFTHLTKEGSRLIVEEFDKRMKTTVRHKELGRDVSYQHLMRLEAYKLVKHLLGEKEYESFKIWW